MDWTIWGLNPCGGQEIFPFFCKTSGAAVGSTQPPFLVGTEVFSGSKVARHEVDHDPAPSTAENKDELYLYFCCMPSWHGHRQRYPYH
jgi:hypothetical protein